MKWSKLYFKLGALKHKNTFMSGLYNCCSILVGVAWGRCSMCKRQEFHKSRIIKPVWPLAPKKKGHGDRGGRCWCSGPQQPAMSTWGYRLSPLWQAEKGLGWLKWVMLQSCTRRQMSLAPLCFPASAEELTSVASSPQWPQNPSVQCSLPHGDTAASVWHFYNSVLRIWLLLSWGYPLGGRHFRYSWAPVLDEFLCASWSHAVYSVVMHTYSFKCPDSDTFHWSLNYCLLLQGWTKT